MQEALDRASSHALNRYLNRRGRKPLSDLAWIAEQKPSRWPRWAWDVRVMTRAEFCAFLDGRAREAKHEADSELCRDISAWARGEAGCVWIAIWTCAHVHRGTTTQPERRQARGARKGPER